MKKYSIVRIYHPSLKIENEILKTELTFEEASFHCQHYKNNPQNNYFDCFTDEKITNKIIGDIE